MTLRILVRGGGDLASGSAIRLWRAGWEVLITELDQPRAVRRLVSFAQAIYDRHIQIEEVTAYRVEDVKEAIRRLAEGYLPVLVDPEANVRDEFKPHVLVDGRMRKLVPELGMNAAPLVIGLGPGFSASKNCHAVIETNRGPFLGRVIWNGEAEADTGMPEKVAGRQTERVLRAPEDGTLEPLAQIGLLLSAGEPVAMVHGEILRAPFDGALRGLMQAGLMVRKGEKVGDLDPRGDPRLSRLVSDKALSIGGGVLEAILAVESLRPHFWNLKGS